AADAKASELPATGVSVPRPPGRSSMSQSFGAGYYPSERAPARPETHPKAVPALVLGILSLVLCGLFTGIPAIFMGRRAANHIRYHSSRYTGLGVASGGVWTGLVGTILSAIFIGLLVTPFVVGLTSASHSQTTCHTVAPHHLHHARTC